MEVRKYHTADGRIPFDEWMSGLDDRIAIQAVLARITRLQAGNPGDWKSVGKGVFELQIHTGPGYRVYCGKEGDRLVLLLSGSAKGSQAKAIERAHEYWKDYKSRR